jgi:CheY-like chemotaxis protein
LGQGSSFHFTAVLGVGNPVTETAAPAEPAVLCAPVVEFSAAVLVTDRAVQKEKKQLRILLAEDNAINQKIACHVLEKQGHHVTVAADGRQALSALDQAHFDVVLMDVQMPEMDGFETTGAIRARERGTGVHLPIIAMTAHAMQGDRERCIAAGMDSYISKPLAIKELIELLERFSAGAPQEVSGVLK